MRGQAGRLHRPRLSSPQRGLTRQARSVTASPPEIYQFTEGGPGPDHEAARSLFLDTVELPTAEATVEHSRAATAPLALAQLQVLGGAMALAMADRLGIAAVAEGTRTLQAAQAGEVPQMGMGTVAAPEASKERLPA